MSNWSLLSTSQLSMSPTELGIQRKGYAAALTHERVIQAIKEGT